MTNTTSNANTTPKARGFAGDLSPYIHDQYTCADCGAKAQLECHQCNKFFCVNCSLFRPPKSYFFCPRCHGRLYSINETKKRFIGSKRPQKRMEGIGKRQKIVNKKGRIIDKGKPLTW